MVLSEKHWTEIGFSHGENPVAKAFEKICGLANLRTGPIEVLKPVTRVKARRNSLSRVYGRGKQPPHTDGAHLEHPPKYILLWSEQANQSHARTHLRTFDVSMLCPDFWGPFSRSIWTVRSSAARFHYRRVVEANGGIRWDSACFQRSVLGDLKPSEVDKELEKLPVREFAWSNCRALLFDNSKVLHGRNSASNLANDDRVLKRVSFYEQ